MTRRIMVALDDSAPSLAALEAAARLAAELSAEIFGVFIEDTNLISAAGLPGTSVVSYQGAQEPLNAAVIMSSLRARARNLRAAVERTALAHGIAWRFETIRGHVSEEILRAAATSDMIALGFAAMSSGRGVFGVTASAIIEQARCTVLVVRRPPPPARRIVVLTAGSAQAREIGRSLARMARADLVIQETPANRSLAFDILSRLAPSYLVIDRPSLASLGITPRDLGQQLQVEGLIVTDGEARVSPDAPGPS